MIVMTVGYAQQRPTFSTYVYNGLAINPAYAGSQNMFSAIFTNRNQWVNIEGAPVFQSLTAQTTFMENQVGAGLNVTRDAIGSYQTYSVYGSYAYKIRMSKNILAMGLQGGFDHTRANFDEVRLVTPDPTFANYSKFSPNFGVGLYLANPHYFIGISVPHILEPKAGNTEDIAITGRSKRYYYMNFGNVMEVSKSVKINPSVLLRYQQSGPFTFDANVNVILNEVVYLGVSYRYQDAVVLMTQMLLNENFRVGYAYDIPTSSLGGFTAGTHEIMINYRIKIKGHNKDGLCPVYF